MRFSVVFAALACFLAVGARAEDPPEVERARQEVERVRALVEAGATPAAKLRETEKQAAEAQDEAVLARALSVNVEDLTEPEAAEMVAAAQRITDLRKAELERAKLLLEKGALPLLAYGDYVESFDRARRALEAAQARRRALTELADIVRLETAELAGPDDSYYGALPAGERYDGNGKFQQSDVKLIMQAFLAEFARPLPVSANGATALHRSMGFDHRGRVDVAVDPDRPEGRWLRRLLESLDIPYYAFRRAVPGASTGAHIHIGPPSQRLRRGGS